MPTRNLLTVNNIAAGCDYNHVVGSSMAMKIIKQLKTDLPQTI